MKALSIRQPWAWLICAGYKDVENRYWPTKFRGRIYVHAGMKLDNKAWEGMWNRGLPVFHSLLLEPIVKQQLGAIIGEVDIVDCKYRFGEENDNLYSVWHEVGMYGFLLTNPILYDKPIPCKGKLGFFSPPAKKEKVI